MKTEELISQLSQDLKPVRPLPGTGLLVGRWVLLGLLLVAAALTLFHPRADLSAQWQNSATLVQLLSFAGLFLLSLVLLAWSLFPGKPHLTIWEKVLPGLLICFFLYQLGRVMQLDKALLLEGLEWQGLECALAASLVGGVTALFLLRRARRGASVTPLKSGLILGLASLGAGGIAITLHCGNENSLHIGLWHLLIPLLVLQGIGALFGLYFLRW